MKVQKKLIPLPHAGVECKAMILALLLALYPSVSFAAEPLKSKGIIRAQAEATITTDLSSRITSLPFREGESFAAGDTLIVFDCAKLKSEISALQASARAEELLFSNNRKLLARGAIGANEVNISQARYEKAHAEASALHTRLQACTFKAPYDGRILQRLAQEQETPGISQPVLHIVSSRELEVEVIVPSQWLTWLKPQAPFQFTIDETGETVQATVMRLGAAVDPVSQTIKLYGSPKSNSRSVLPGMSGAATFSSFGS